MRKIVKLKQYQIIKYMYRYIQIGDTTCIYTIEDTINYSNKSIGRKNWKQEFEWDYGIS